jgi:hypothetical protein
MLLEFPDMHSQLSRPVAACLVGLLLAGCGTTKSQRATEQLLMSDAVDRSVASIDFRPLSGKRVFLDTKYLQNLKSSDFVNTEYVTSSLRQQMLSAACLLEESADKPSTSPKCVWARWPRTAMTWCTAFRPAMG